MIIQHNIMALNAHRQLGGNNSLVSKNLEKLSSGFKINRAGDDAAGLAISEKMRAQITGLSRAQANAQDGISLVQTAEGALTEVHSMLNRMVDLATQASNGTMQADDRNKIQDEMDALVGEIDRISQSTNFNGINLLDGSLGSTGASGVAVNVKYGSLNNNPDILKLNAAGATSSNFKLDATKMTAGTKYSIDLTFADATGALQKKSVEFTAAGNTAGDNNAVIKTALEEAFGTDYNITFGANNDTFTITAKDPGSANKMEILSTGLKNATTGAAVTGGAGAAANAAGTDAFYSLDIDKMGTFTGAAGQKVEDYMIEINGQKFAFATTAGATELGRLDPSINVVTTANNPPVAGDRAALITLINDKTGIASATNGAGTLIDLKAGTAAGSTGNGLTLQIGDTAEAFNKVTVSVDDMGAQGLGIQSVKVTDQDQAAASIKTIKAAINTVSKNRSAMGALQNRLEHTINNLSVATENMTAAESRIRDVDMAKEMMNFTKNNVLSQAAQAMLAQANQQPQQVLQLLR